VLEIIHGDLCSPITPVTPGKKKLFLLLVDDYSQLMWLVLFGSKAEAPKAIKWVRVEAEATSGKKMSCLCTDRGDEFCSNDFTDYCAETGV
jgi:hypothetical protein